MKCTTNSKLLLTANNILWHLKNIQTWLVRSVLILPAFIFQGCHLNTFKIAKNEQISNESKQEFHALNDKLFKAVETTDHVLLKKMMASNLAEKNDIDQFINTIDSIPKSENYKILDEYYIENSATGVLGTIISGDSDENEYFLHYMIGARESYVALLLISIPGREMLITSIYGKYGNTWKLNSLYFGAYTIINRTPVELFNMAKQSYNKSYLIDAVNYASLSTAILKPAGDLLQYKSEDEIKNFYEKVVRETKNTYQFPLTIADIDSKPKIFRISPETEHGFFPIIQYLSTINLKDTVALKKENEKIKKKIGQIFPGIDKNKQRVYYRAFNELSDGKKLVHMYGFIDTLTNTAN